MIVQIVRVKTTLPEDEMLAVARERADEFRRIPGLVQKYYVKLGEPNCYAGIYVWASRDALNAYRGSELAASIPTAYKSPEPPMVEIYEGLFQLRE